VNAWIDPYRIEHSARISTIIWKSWVAAGNSGSTIRRKP
jgi:hypothetical protein